MSVDISLLTLVVMFSDTVPTDLSLYSMYSLATGCPCSALQNWKDSFCANTDTYTRHPMSCGVKLAHQFIVPGRSETSTAWHISYTNSPRMCNYCEWWSLNSHKTWRESLICYFLQKKRAEWPTISVDRKNIASRASCKLSQPCW